MTRRLVAALQFSRRTLSKSGSIHSAFHVGPIRFLQQTGESCRLSQNIISGKTGFSVQKARNSNDNFPTWIGGTGLDRGHLQFFSKVSALGHRPIPQYWPKKLRAELRNPPQHLDTLEEVWWLGCWTGIENIRRAQRLQIGLADVDWQFTIGSNALSSGLKVNLEVKRLKSDNIRQARGEQLNAHEFAQFCSDQVLRKFRPSESDEVNVLAISLFGEID